MDLLSPIRDLFGFVFPFLESVPIVRAILGFILVLFLPGFAWTFVFFKRININLIERVTLSFALSIVLVTLSLLLLNVLIGIEITGFNSALTIIVITILPVVIYYLNRFIRRKKGSAT